MGDSGYVYGLLEVGNLADQSRQVALPYLCLTIDLLVVFSIDGKERSFEERSLADRRLTVRMRYQAQRMRINRSSFKLSYNY